MVVNEAINNEDKFLIEIEKTRNIIIEKFMEQKITFEEFNYSLDILLEKRKTIMNASSKK